VGILFAPVIILSLELKENIILANQISLKPLMKKQRSNIEIFDKKLEQTKNLVDRISSHDVGEVTIITLNKIIEAIEFLAKEVKELKNDE
jgi:hypothetical protein